MAATGGVDYQSTYFELHTCTRIIGKPTYETIYQLYQELKTNASSVLSTIGGEAHDHLGLIIPPTSYAMISNIPYLCPVMPPPFFVAPGTDPQLANHLRQQHTENMKVYREYLGVEQALKKQIVAAVEPRWLQALRNHISNSITMPVLDIINYLYRTHGKISLQMLTDKE
jgi:hypothetical protein